VGCEVHPPQPNWPTQRPAPRTEALHPRGVTQLSMLTMLCSSISNASGATLFHGRVQPRSRPSLPSIPSSLHEIPALMARSGGGAGGQGPGRRPTLGHLGTNSCGRRLEFWRLRLPAKPVRAVRAYPPPTLAPLPPSGRGSSSGQSHRSSATAAGLAGAGGSKIMAEG
jgi:hypothetical protein